VEKQNNSEWKSLRIWFILNLFPHCVMNSSVFSKDNFTIYFTCQLVTTENLPSTALFQACLICFHYVTTEKLRRVHCSWPIQFVTAGNIVLDCFVPCILISCAIRYHGNYCFQVHLCWPLEFFTYFLKCNFESPPLICFSYHLSPVIHIPKNL